MNKIKATKKEMRQNYRILSIGYCDAQYLLNYKSPVAYSTRAEGWACDYYDIDGVIVCTGYDTIKDKNTKLDYAVLREYEKKAQEANTAEETNKLLKEFIALCIA